MVTKRLLRPERLRTVPSQFSWLDHRLVRERHLERCSTEALALYLFLVTVADAKGLSYYADASVCTRLGVSGGGVLGDVVLVDAVQSHERVEDHKPRADSFDRLHQPLAVGAMVEAQCGDVDDGDVEGLEAGVGGLCDALQPGAHDVAGVLGGEQQDGTRLVGGEAAQARDAGGDREVEGEEGLAALGLAADDADGLAPPQRVDEPLVPARAVLQLDRRARREAVRRHGAGVDGMLEVVGVDGPCLVQRGGGQRIVGDAVDLARQAAG